MNINIDIEVFVIIECDVDSLHVIGYSFNKDRADKYCNYLNSLADDENGHRCLHYYIEELNNLDNVDYLHEIIK